MTDSTHNILLIGAGQLGSRHLQGLAHINIPVSIEVIDPNESSLETARKRFSEIVCNSKIKDIEFQTTSNKKHDRVDLAIIATNADVRADIVASLTADRQVRNILLEKFLFQKKSDFDNVGELLQRQQVKAFVNCPRRLYPFYQQLKKDLSSNKPITFCVDGSQWGLGCNIIHFLDLFAFLTGDCSVRVNGVLLDNEILESKRPGFVEFTGTIRGVNTRGDHFEISSRTKPDLPLCISVTTGNRRIEIHEQAGTVLFFDDATANVRQEPFSGPYQSQLTGAVAQDILVEGRCGLTSYNEAMQLHLPILETFLGHLNATGKTPYDHCPIT